MDRQTDLQRKEMEIQMDGESEGQRESSEYLTWNFIDNQVLDIGRHPVT